MINFFNKIIRKNNRDNNIIYKNGVLPDNSKICIFAHYDEENIINNSVLNYLIELNNNNYQIIFVSTSEKLNLTNLKKIEKYTLLRIIRRNIGYDFYSWKTGFQFINKPFECTQILLANDSVVRSIYSLDKMFSIMENKNYDIWGVTDNFEINHHIQSYFLVFQNKSLQNKFILKYMNQINILKDKQKIINQYEVGLISLALLDGLKIGSYCDYLLLLNILHKKGQIKDKNFFVNSTLYFPIELLNYFNVPFIKKELFKINPHNKDINLISNYIKKL